VDRGHAARGGDGQRGARGLDQLLVGGQREAVAERPGGLLAQDARLEVDLSPGPLDVALRVRERRRVQSERVPVVREQRRRDVAGDLVEQLQRGLKVRPAEPT
jgi:hypothetical protein